MGEQGPLRLGGGQGPVADAVDRGLDGVGVDADHGDGCATGVRTRPRSGLALGQDIGAAEEAGHGGAVADIDVQVGGLGQGLAFGRGQSGADLDPVARPVDHAVHTDLLGLGLHRQARGVRDAHEIRQVRAVARQGLRELDADARAGGIRVHLVAADAEAVLRHQGVVLAAQAGVLPQGQRGSGGADGRPPGLAAGQCTAEGGQGVAPLGLGGGPQIGIHRCGAALLLDPLLALPVLGLLVQCGARQTKPGGGAGGVRQAGLTGRHTLGEGRRLLQIAAGEEDQLRGPGGGDVRRRPLVRGRRRLARLGGDDAPGDGRGEGAGLAGTLLQEAPAGLGVISEGLAAGIGQAGRLAGVEFDLLEGLVVFAEEVGPLGDHHLAPCPQGAAREGDAEANGKRECEGDAGSGCGHGDTPAVMGPVTSAL